MSGVMIFGEDFFFVVVRIECERIILDVDGIKFIDVLDIFLFLKVYYN